MAYDPKRPRPRTDADEPAPVDALLGDDAGADPAESAPAPTEPGRAAEPPAVEEPTEVVEAAEAAEADQPDAPVEAPDEAEPVEPAAVLGRAVPGAASNGSGARSAPDVPVAPAPEEGTTNRAVLAAAIGGVLVALLGWLVWHRRRSGTND
jgi:hypothetical protein